MIPGEALDRAGGPFLSASPNRIALKPAVSFYEIEGMLDYLSDIPGLSFQSMEQLIETCPYSMATSVSHFLDQRVNASGVDITNFEITSISPMSVKFGELHLLTWKEEDTCVMGIFKVEHEELPCNYLLHYLRKSSSLVPRQISWSVKNMECLGELFLTFEHVWTWMQSKGQRSIIDPINSDVRRRYGPGLDDADVLNFQTSPGFGCTSY